MTTPLIAVLTDNHEFASELCGRFQDGFDVQLCSRGLSGVLSEIEDPLPDALVLDFTNTSAGGHLEDETLQEIQHRFSNLQMFMVTGEDCPEPLARRAACSGLIHICERAPSNSVVAAVRRFFTESQTARAESTVQETPNHNTPPADVVSSWLARQFETNCSSLQWMLEELEVAACHDVTILLIGETGVGKTFLSRLIHEASPRRDEPFVTVACGALPGELIESELFGYTKGAFTGAHADKQGKFVAAAGGTILLDEIDVLGLEQQVKLLRVVESGEFEPLGSNRTIESRARLVVASNLDLQPLVEQGRFRPDLYYRLNMLKFDLPPLRERAADIVPLARKLVAQLAKRHGVSIDRIDDSLLASLQANSWPGNIRELENVLRRAVIFCRNGVLTAGRLPRNVLGGQPGPGNDASVSINGETPGAAKPVNRTLGGQIETTEREIIRQALTRNNHSRTKTAKHLGISRVTLYNKMRKYNLA